MATINKAASKPHERFVFNLAIFHFLVPALLFGTKQLWLIFTIPVLCSLFVMATIGRQALNSNGKSELVQAHWQLAWKRCKYLMLAYTISLSFFLIAVLLTQDQADQAMRTIHLAVAGWFSLIPITIAIILLGIMENSALIQARKGMLPKDMKI